MKINVTISKKTLKTQDESFFFFFAAVSTSVGALRPSESISGVWFKKKIKKRNWQGFDPSNMFFFPSKSQSEGVLFSVMFFPSTYQSKRVQHVKCVVFFFRLCQLESDDVGGIQMEHNCSYCGGGTGAEGWSVSPGRGADGSGRGKKKHKTHINSLKYLYQKWINIITTTIFFFYFCL